MLTPRYCRKTAYARFVAYVDDLDTTAALVGAAVAVSMHALDDADPGVVEERLDALAIAVGQQGRSQSPRGALAHLHQVLFERERFAGNQVDFYDPANSYLPRVLTTRRGIPITLALIYKAVAERVGLKVVGIGAPGHFPVRLHDESGPLLIDPFHKGRVLSDEEAFARMESTLGTVVPRAASLLEPVSHAEWLSRILRNLESTHRRRAQPRDAAAMNELRQLVEPVR